MMELLLLLLPVAAASGWLAAKRSERRAGAVRKNYDPAYFQGLNYLLNEQPDKAIDIFVQMLEVDSDTVETHLALGNLFRQRGEVDRAIRIHQNLIARPTLDRDQRAQALLELGQDYMRAGLFDRAENLFDELIKTNLYQEEALKNLQIIYEQEKDWDQCLLVVRRLESLTSEPLHTEKAHYYCEKAEQACNEKDYMEASNLLKKAQRGGRNCVRATILLGRMDMDRGAYKAAICTFQKLEHQDRAYLSEVLPVLIECYTEVGHRKELKDYLHELFQRNHGLPEMLALAELIQSEEGNEEAVAFVTNYLQDSPSIEGLGCLILLHKKGADGVEMDTLRRLVTHLLDARSAYLCNHCGFTAKSLHWQCPGCRSWSSIKPAQSAAVNRTLGD